MATARPLSDLRSDVRALTNIRSVSRLTDAEIDTELAEVHYETWDLASWPQKRLRFEGPVVDGVVTLPSGAIGVSRVLVDGKPLVALDVNSAAAGLEGYTFEDGEVVFYPLVEVSTSEAPFTASASGAPTWPSFPGRWYRDSSGYWTSYFEGSWSPDPSFPPTPPPNFTSNWYFDPDISPTWNAYDPNDFGGGEIIEGPPPAEPAAPKGAVVVYEASAPRFSVPTDTPWMDGEYHRIYAYVAAARILGARAGDQSKIKEFQDRADRTLTRMRTRYLSSRDSSTIKLKGRW